eukprot:TRINITY_DN4475_c0_g2_i1.p2 TRINITY_DN4475_c0_g2~~TRINITY_DN4475_c0_g2_i1.p2  ORF type:complete len:291 (-),score=37.43 TRINITY_DN4475_c0_g2_i1:419-1291(-)
MLVSVCPTSSNTQRMSLSFAVQPPVWKRSLFRINNYSSLRSSQIPLKFQKRRIVNQLKASQNEDVETSDEKPKQVSTQASEAEKEEVVVEKVSAEKVSVENEVQSEDVATLKVASQEQKDAEDEEKDMFAVKELWEEVKSPEELGKRGEGFFLAQLLILTLIFFPPFKIYGVLTILSVLMIIAGLVTVWLSVFSIGKSLSPFPVPRKNNVLTTTGVYGIVRHPMYSGVLLVCGGLTLFSGSETRLLLLLLLTYLFNKKASMEEKFLLERYPEEYKEYMEKTTKRFIPLLF